MAPKHKQDDDSPPTGGPIDGILNLLSRILDFLFDKIQMLPKPLRAVAYFVFLAFFCATAWRLIDGHYVVRGVVWDGENFAQACEIRVRGDYFSTNSKGMYYAVLTPIQYYRFMVAGEIDLPVVCRKPDGSPRRVKSPKVTLSWWDDEFSEIDLAAGAEASRTSKEPGGFSFGLIASAYAQEPPAPAQNPPGRLQPAPPQNTYRFPSSGDRLVLERITLGDKAQNMREVEFEIELGNKEKPLLLEGAEAGDLPMKSKVTFGESYYFDVPQASRGTRVEIEMEAPGLFGREEAFKLDIPRQYDRPVRVEGNKGSILVLRLVPRTPPS
jgi:hypothetical protein